MTTSTRPLPQVSLEAWLAHEAASDRRHELVAGALFPMTGATLRHARLVMAVAARLHGPARAQGCWVYAESGRLHTGSAGYYPDVVVSCESRADDRYLAEPCFVLEVLSPSTESTDRREKRTAYTGLPSVGAYVILAQDDVRAEVHERTANGWQHLIAGPGSSFPVPCLDRTIDLDDLYGEVDG